MNTVSWLLPLFILGSVVPGKHTALGNVSSTTDDLLDSEDFEPDYSYVGSIKFHLKEATIPKLITEVAMHNINCPMVNCSISLVDVIEATQLARIPSNNLVEAAQKLNITVNDGYNICLIYECTAENFEYLLQIFDLTFSDIYKNFVGNLSNPGQSIPAILNTVNVSVIDFMNAQAYGNDSTRLQVLSRGNYSKENLLAVLRVANKTISDILNLIPLNTILKNVQKLPALEFTNFAKNLGVTSAGLEQVYRHLNITPINFLSYPSFIQIITGFYDLLNPEEVLATLISHSKMVTSKLAKALTRYQSSNNVLITEYSKLDVELVENPLVQYPVTNVTFKSTTSDMAFLEILESGVKSFVQVARNYSPEALNNCTYISKLPYGGLYVENVSNAHVVKNDIVIGKSSNTVYHLGSPIICNGKLYGISCKQNETSIAFSTFIKETSGSNSDNNTYQPPTSAKPGGNNQNGPHNGKSNSSGTIGVFPHLLIYAIIIVGVLEFTIFYKTG